jgi:hypothetical protein
LIEALGTRGARYSASNQLSSSDAAACAAVSVAAFSRRCTRCSRSRIVDDLGGKVAFNALVRPQLDDLDFYDTWLATDGEAD